MKRTGIVIIGSGNVAEALAAAVAGSGALRLVQIYARNAAAGRKLADKYGCSFAAGGDRLHKADLYILAVSDTIIQPLSAALDFHGGVVAHTAGSVDVKALSGKITHRAVLYPLQTFTKGRKANFQHIPLLVEGLTPEALECVRAVASALSSDVRELSSAERERVHLAAVFACNFTNYMYTVGEQLLEGAGLPFDLLKPLIRETALKAITSASPRLVQTGPAVRGDYKTKARHMELLVENPDLKSLYINLSKNIWETSKKK